MLTMRCRGKAQKWYIRGSATYGERIAEVAEFSSGTIDKAVASHLMAERERELREELIFGPKAVAARGIMADAFEAYLTKPKPPNSTDVARIGVMNERIGAMALSDPRAALHAFREVYLTRHAPAGQDRYRSLLQAAVKVYNERYDMPVIAPRRGSSIRAASKLSASRRISKSVSTTITRRASRLLSSRSCQLSGICGWLSVRNAGGRVRCPWPCFCAFPCCLYARIP